MNNCFPTWSSLWGGSCVIKAELLQKCISKGRNKKRGRKRKGRQKASKKRSEYGWRRKNKRDVSREEADENKRCISAYCSSCDAGQCSSTESVMSLMQRGIKVILHKPPSSSLHGHTQCRDNGAQTASPLILSSCPSPSSLLSTTFPRCTGAVRARH